MKLILKCADIGYKNKNGDNPRGENTNNITSNLKKINIQLENWRKNKRNHLKPTPEKLLEAAVELVKLHSIILQSQVKF